MRDYTEQEIEILGQADHIMSHLEDSQDRDSDILKVGKLLHEIGFVKDPNNKQETVDVYLKDLYTRTIDHFRKQG